MIEVVFCCCCCNPSSVVLIKFRLLCGWFVVFKLIFLTTHKIVFHEETNDRRFGSWLRMDIDTYTYIYMCINGVLSAGWWGMHVSVFVVYILIVEIK